MSDQPGMKCFSLPVGHSISQAKPPLPIPPHFFLDMLFPHGDLHQEKPGDYENDAYGG